MTFEEFKNEVRQIPQIDEAFGKVWEHVDTQSPVFDDFRILQNNWEDAKRAYHQNLIDYAIYSGINAKTRSGILNFINSLLEKDFQAKRSDEKIAARILVISPNLLSEAAIVTFFPFEYFRQVDFAQYDDNWPPGQNRATDESNLAPWQQSIYAADLVIFDNYAHPEVQVEDEIRKIQMEKLLWLLNYTDRCVVWFGGHNEVVSQNPDRIYAANSRFALYARVREMLEFLKYMAEKEPEKRD